MISRTIERLRIAKSLAEFGKRKFDQEARRAMTRDDASPKTSHNSHRLIHQNGYRWIKP